MTSDDPLDHAVQQMLAGDEASFRVVYRAVQPALLREQGCHLILTPRPPEGADILQKRLFEDRYVVFHDPAQRAAPATRAAKL